MLHLVNLAYIYSNIR